MRVARAGLVSWCDREGVPSAAIRAVTGHQSEDPAKWMGVFLRYLRRRVIPALIGQPRIRRRRVPVPEPRDLGDPQPSEALISARVASRQ